MRAFTLLLVLLTLSLNGCAPSQFVNMPVDSPTDTAQVENTWPPTVSVANVTTSDGKAVYFPQMSYANEEEAGLGGELLLLNGCLYMHDQFVLWPPGYSIEVTGKTVQVVDEANGNVIQVGDYITSGGGVKDSNSLPTVIDALEQQLPETCALNIVVWVGSSVKKADATE